MNHPGARNVLVVEDDEGTREVVARILTRGGHHVLTAASCEEAVELCRREAPKIGLLVVDAQMYGERGKNLQDWLGENCTSASTLVISGYPCAALSAALGGMAFLQKPFSREELSAAVEELIGPAPSQSERACAASPAHTSHAEGDHDVATALAALMNDAALLEECLPDLPDSAHHLAELMIADARRVHRLLQDASRI